MRATSIHQIGNIVDSQDNILLKMWSASVSTGKRPLTKHQHLNFEIMMVNSGSGLYTTETADYPILPGDIFVFCSNEWHCITDVGNEGLNITNLQFDPAYIGNNFINPNFCFNHNKSFRNRIESENVGCLSTLFDTVKEELSSKSTEYMQAVKSYLYILLIRLVREFNYLSDTNSFNNEQLLTVHHILTYIDSHFSEKITLQELSALAGLTSNYLCSLFKQVSGMTIWDYISAKRIEKATQLIASNNRNRNIIDIAAECGYNNTANFNKIFKKLTGMTPSEYCKNAHTMIS